MRFMEENDGISLMYGRNLFMHCLKPYIMTENNEKYYLTVQSVTEKEICFVSQEHHATMKLMIENVGSQFVLRMKGTYHPENLFECKNNLHLAEEKAMGIEIEDLSEINAFTAIYRKHEWWVRVAFPQTLSELPEHTQGIFWTGKKGKGFVSTLCDEKFKSAFSGLSDGGFELYVFDNTLCNECDTVAAVFGFGDDLNDIIPKVLSAGFIATNRKPVLRKQREYPGVLEYLGWCSWDAFALDVSQEGVLAKAQELQEKGIPARWLMLDDMWGDVKNNYLGVNSTRELWAFEADPKRFPQGLSGVVEKLHNQYGVQVGLWHPTTGYWRGIDPHGEIANDDRYKDLLFWSQEGQLVHSFEYNKIEQYYERQYQYYSDCGVDFVKVDNQACLRRHAKRVMSIGEAAKNMHHAIEAAVDKYFNGQMINCMGMSTENCWNRKSAVSRMSCDYIPDSRERFNFILRQSCFNSMVQGAIYYGDWDMWWTYDSQAYKNAAAHAISGGPVYISDELGKTNPELVMPLVFSDGRVIRMDNPAHPCDDCLFEDTNQTGKAFKMYNRSGDCGAVIAYNLTDEGTLVQGSISAKDARLSGETYLAYEFFTGNTCEVRLDDKIEFELKEGNDFKFVVFVPLVNHKAVLGLKEKYVGFETIRENEVLDDGELLVYGVEDIYINDQIVKTTSIGNNLYTVQVKKGDRYKI